MAKKKQKKNIVGEKKCVFPLSIRGKCLPLHTESLTTKNPTTMTFTTLTKSVGNPSRTTRKYYKHYNNAKTALDNEVKDLVKNGWKIIRHIDEFNTSKGLYCYEYEMTTSASEPATLALIENYTED